MREVLRGVGAVLRVRIKKQAKRTVKMKGGANKSK